MNNLKIQTSSSTPLNKLGQKQQPPQLLQQQQQQSPTPASKNEKEILIQRVSSSSLDAESTPQQQQAQSPIVAKQQNKSDSSLNGKGAVELNYNKSPSQTTTVSKNQLISKAQTNLLKPKQQAVVNVPQFYYPNGKPDEKHFKGIDDAETMKQINAEFKKCKEGKMFKDEFAEVCKLLGLPKYCKILLFRACTSSSKLNYLTYQLFEQTWAK